MSLSEFKGGFLIANENNIYSIKYNRDINFHKKYNDQKIQNIFILNPNHVLVQFEEKYFFHVYNLYTGELVIEYQLPNVIKFILPDLRNDYVVKLSQKVVTLAVVLVRAEIHCLKFTAEGKVDLEYKIGAAGIECISLELSTVNDAKSCNIFGLTLEDGSTITVSKQDGVFYAKPKYTADLDYFNEQMITYKIVTFMKDGLVLLG